MVFLILFCCKKVCISRNRSIRHIFSISTVVAGIGEYEIKTEQELLSFGQVFPSDPLVDIDKAASLECSFQNDRRWWPLAARLHAQKSEKREMECRNGIVTPTKFLLFCPNSLHPMQIKSYGLVRDIAFFMSFMQIG